MCIKKMKPISKNVIIEYEAILLNQKINISKFFFNWDSYTNEQLALDVIRYSFKTYLGWSPQEVESKISLSLLKSLKLNEILAYINFPIELDSTLQIKYLAHLLYPEQVKYDARNLVLQIYKDILERRLKRFPKSFLSNTDGILKSNICFLYMLEQNSDFSTIKELYEHFAGSKGIHTLRKYHLMSICTAFYESPLEFLHTSLPDEQKSNFFYHYYKYKNTIGKMIPKITLLKKRTGKQASCDDEYNDSKFFYYYRLYRLKVKSRVFNFIF
ncbi:hypothetical protein [Anaerocolumna cellulosilytica]|nr:hypothetical protein [Anaerocolumna cellulosilytica]MBB5198094.1 hypothetical protein [Anaerocolumna cellulosilytica]